MTAQIAQLRTGEFMHRAFLIGIVSAPLLIAFVGIHLPAQSPQTPSPKAAKEAAMVHAGQDIYTQKCMQCHAVYEGQSSFGPNLYKEMKKPKGKKTSAEIRVILKNGKGKMPAFQDKLTSEDTDKLLAYLHTL